MLAVFLVCAPIALAGHFLLWVSFWNHVQGTALPIWINTALSHLAKTFCFLIPWGIGFAMFSANAKPPTFYAALTYFVICSLIALIGLPWLMRGRQKGNYDSKLKTLSSFHQTYHACRAEAIENTDNLTRLLISLPGNEVFDIENSEKQIEIPRLGRSLDGLSIAHISDLHFTGKIPKSFFDRAIDMVNDMDPDIVAITGDLVDRAEYMSWIPVTLGRLEAKHGVYVILGNHDCKHNLSNMRLMLTEIGLTTMSGRTKTLEVGDQRIVLAGNELPWIVPAADMEDMPAREENELRILLAHTPDQIHWARHYDFDLMLAGHTHGGQFCLPLVGAVFCPSRLPLQYASGLIYQPPTVLHITRGLSSEIPLRWNCRPEITKLVLRCPKQTLQTQLAEERKAKPKELASVISSLGSGFPAGSRAPSP